MNDAPKSGLRPAPPDMGLGEALAPVATLLALFAATLVFLEPTTEMLVVMLLASAAVAGWVARRHGVDWDEIQRATGERFAAVLPGILILLAIGMLIGTWMLSGTVPFLVYWGLHLVDPAHLLVTAFLATAVMSLVTGTSWGSAGTLGVALLGMAAALDVSLAATAGAVVSGAYFGDKLSPLSDTTNCTAIAAGTPLATHIRHMLWTAVPSFVVAVVAYSLVSTGAGDGDMPERASVLLADLERAFDLGPWVLLPPAVAVIATVRRMPAALAIALSSLVAAVVGVAVQGFGVAQAVAAAVVGFRLDALAARGPLPGAASEAVGDGFVTLVQRGGLYGMAPTLVLVLAAFLLAGALSASGAMDLLIRRLVDSVRSVFGLVAATMTAGTTLVALTSNALVTVLVIGEIFQGVYDREGMARENLSRSLEDSVTLTEPLMPWTVSALFMATTLGVPTLDYLPWAFFCHTGFVFSLTLAALYRRTGLGLTRSG